MRIDPYHQSFPLTGKAIDVFSLQIDKALTDIEMERENRLRIRLSMEEALLRMRDRFGDDQEVEASIEKHFGRLAIQVKLEGEVYNPLSEEETDLEDMCSALLTTLGISPQYIYDGRINILRVQIPLPGMRPLFKIVVSILGGVILGLLFKALPDGGVVSYVEREILSPFYDLWGRILNLVCGPIIFLIIITATLNGQKISDYGGDNRRILARYFFLSMLITGIAMILTLFIYPTPAMIWSAEHSSDGLFRFIMEMIPDDFVSPFLESNTPQLFLMAVVIGGAINAMDTHVKNLTRIIRQANDVGLRVAEWVSRFSPFAISILLGYEILMGRTFILFGLWSCILIALLLSVMFMGVRLLLLAKAQNVSPRLLLKKVWKPFAIAVSTGSLDASYGQLERSCIRELGLQNNFTKISLPNGMIIYMPVSEIGTVAFMVFVATRYNVVTTPSWFLIAAVLSVMLFVATPPVPGANLIAFIALFHQLQIPQEALIDAMIFDIIFGLFANAANQMMLQLEMVSIADRMGLLDKKLLAGEMKST